MLLLKKHPQAFWLLLFLWLAILYSPAFSGPFLLDDLHTILDNPFVHRLSGLWLGWVSGATYSSLPTNYGYRPVTVMVTTLLWLIGGGSTVLFHLFKVCLMWVICRLLFKLWAELFATDALVLYAAVLIFAVNPVHTQVLSYISTISTQLAAMFGLLSALAYNRFFRSGRWADFLMCAAALALATLSKEEGIASLAFVVLTDLYLRFGSQLRSRAWRSLPVLAVVAGACVWLIFHMYEPTQGLVRAYVTRGDYFLTQTRAWIRYVVMAVYPYELNFDNLEFGFSFSLSEPRVLIAVTLNLIIVAVSLWQLRVRPWIALSFAWFYAGLAPASSVVVLSEPVNDHRAFLGYLGLSFLLVFGLAWLLKRAPRAFGVIVISVAVFYSAMTFQRSFFWRSTEAVWTDTVVKNPSSPRAKNNLALEYMGQKRFAEALTVLNACIDPGTSYANCYLNRAVVHTNLGQEEAALADFETGLRLDPIVSSSHLTLARHLIARGMVTRARDLLEKADQFAGGKDLDVRLALIDLFSMTGSIAEAKALIRDSRPRFSGIEKFETRARLLDTL